MVDVFKQPQQSISILNNGEPNKEKGILVFEMTIIGILEFFGVEWGGSTIEQVASMMYDEYNHWSFAQYKHFLANVKKGTYGKIYGKFNPSTLAEWANDYEQERMIAFAQYKPSKIEEVPQVEYVSSERISEAFKPLTEMLNKSIEEDKQKEELEFQKKKEQSIDYAKSKGINVDEIRDEIIRQRNLKTR